MHRIHLEEDHHDILKGVIQEYLELEMESFRDDPETEQGEWVEKVKRAQEAFERFESV